MNIGQAAAASGVSAKMIRHYESIGLIDPADRTGSGYRVYGSRDVHTLRFIRRARNLGFAVPDIQELLALWRNRERASADVKALALHHLGSLQAKVAELQGMIKSLDQLVAACGDDDRPDCPILGDLADETRPAPTSSIEHRFGVTRLG